MGRSSATSELCFKRMCGKMLQQHLPLRKKLKTIVKYIIDLSAQPPQQNFKAIDAELAKFCSFLETQQKAPKAKAEFPIEIDVEYCEKVDATVFTFKSENKEWKEQLKFGGEDHHFSGFRKFVADSDRDYIRLKPVELTGGKVIFTAPDGRTFKPNIRYDRCVGNSYALKNLDKDERKYLAKSVWSLKDIMEPPPGSWKPFFYDSSTVDMDDFLVNSMEYKPQICTETPEY